MHVLGQGTTSNRAFSEIEVTVLFQVSFAASHITSKITNFTKPTYKRALQETL